MSFFSEIEIPQNNCISSDFFRKREIILDIPGGKDFPTRIGGRLFIKPLFIKPGGKDFPTIIMRLFIKPLEGSGGKSGWSLMSIATAYSNGASAALNVFHFS